jgi:hypothetical protein
MTKAAAASRARPVPTAVQAAAEVPAATELNGKSRQRLAAELGLSSVVANVSTIQSFATPTFGEMDLAESVAVLSEKARAVQDGSLAGL